MARLGHITSKIRGKNAGPFTLTIDIFSDDADTHHAVCKALSTARVAALYKTDEADIKRFELHTLNVLNVLEFSMPRPTIQGSLTDRDMHASGWAWLLAELDVNIGNFVANRLAASQNYHQSGLD